MSYKKKKQLSYMIIGCLVIVAFACRHISVNNTYLRHFANQCRSSIYIGLYSAWVIYLKKHVVDMKMRRCLTQIGALMVLWFLIRTIKFLVFFDPLEERICWYLYYIPMILIPTLGLKTAILMDSTDGDKSRKKTTILMILAILLIAAVLTNDLHQKVFYFPEGFLFSNEIYNYGIIFICIQVWVMFCLIMMEIALICKSRIPGKKRFWFPVIPGILLLIWNVCNILRVPLIHRIAGDMSAICCLLMAAIYQGCIACGLIQINSRYLELFQAAGGLNAEITDCAFDQHYQSGKFPDISTEIRQGVLTAPFVMEDGIRISHMYIRGGHLFWTEDISLLVDQYEDIKEQQEELKEKNLLLQKTYQQEAKRRKIEEQNRLLNLIQSQTAGQLELISCFMRELEKTESKDVYERLLGQIVVVGTYLKRRKNFLLTIHSENQELLGADDLIQGLAESCSALMLCHIRALYYVNVSPLVLHDVDVLKCYDYFEWLTEQLFNKMDMIFFRVVMLEESLMISVHIVSGYDLDRLLSGRPGTEVQREDEKEWLIRWRIS